MPRSFPASPDRLKDGIEPVSPLDPHELNRRARFAAEVALGHDVEWIAADCGLSARELGKQREIRPLDNEGGPAGAGRQWAYRLCLLVDSVRRRYGTERTAPLARLVAEAAGHALAAPLPAAAEDGNRDDALRVLGRAMSAFGQAAESFAAAAENGVDAREAAGLIPDVDRALERMHSVRALLVARSVPKRAAVLVPRSRKQT